MIYFFGKRAVPCGDCSEGYCTMNCGPAIPAPKLPAPKLPDGFKVLCSVCGEALEAAVHFSKGQLKKKHPRCRACSGGTGAKFHSTATGGFASRREQRRAQDLENLQRIGEISDLQMQVPIELIPKQQGERAVVWVADFTYTERSGEEVWEDCKGHRTAEYVIKRKLVLWRHNKKIRET